MDALHGPRWHERADAPRGRRSLHVAISAAALSAAVAAALGRRRVAALAAGFWAAGTAEFTARRIAAGPPAMDEMLTIIVTSAAIPPVATVHWLRGRVAAALIGRLPAAVLFDRDGTLVEDVPYNGDPAQVRPVPGARAALDRLRERGIPVAVVSNQSGVARGLLSVDQVEAVNRRVEELLGPFAGWTYCPHGPDDGCDCRKPAPGLIRRAAAMLGVDPARCAVVGDIGADVEAASAVGARAVLVPTTVTRPDEVERAPEVAPNLEAAVERLLRSRA